jgi:hypothetical protein
VVFAHADILAWVPFRAWEDSVSITEFFIVLCLSCFGKCTSLLEDDIPRYHILRSSLLRAEATTGRVSGAVGATLGCVGGMADGGSLS